MSAPANPLRRRDLAADPFEQFARWFAGAVAAAGREAAESACLATVDEEGYPDARMVLVKAFDARGFVFYTGLHSAKGRAIAAHPRAALDFHWAALHRQVRVQGIATRVGDEEADRYFATRPRESQLAAWASEQSEPIANREALEARFEDARVRFGSAPVPRPPYWGGFRIAPLCFEFWQSGMHRLHDRFSYRRRDTEDPWTLTRLAP